MTPEAGTIERDTHIPAPPDVVFAFFVEPDRVVRWMGDAATLEARPGGTFRLEYARGEVASGQYVEIDPPRHVAFTWGWESEGDPVPPGASTVDVTLEPDGDGTLVGLSHSGLDATSVTGHEEGWDYFLPRLVAAVEAELAEDAPT